MIVTDKFVFVHLPRTGGTFVTEVIMEIFSISAGDRLPPAEHCATERILSTCRFLVRSAIHGNFTFHGTITFGPEIAETPLISWLTENGKDSLTGATRNALNLGVDNDDSMLSSRSCPTRLTTTREIFLTLPKTRCAKLRYWSGILHFPIQSPFWKR